ncbi:MAG: KH domain-containing protein [Verrucomicrobia bacterium]|nr:KH domain-containing protein [Verrucomicrobiota bacterium]
MLKAFLEYVLKNLVDAPESVAVHETQRGGRVVYQLQVQQGDVGKVVGKQGQTIAAIRTLVAAAASRGAQRFDVEILEDGRSHPSRDSSEE